MSVRDTAFDREALAATVGDESRLPSAEAMTVLQSVARQVVDAPRETLRREVVEETPLLSDLSLALGPILGEGGMGVVHLAEQRTLGREVAAKTLRPGAQSAQAVGQLVREAIVTGALEHPNVVPVHDIVRGPDGTPIVVLKRIEGRPWDEVLRDPEGAEGAHDPLAWHLGVLRQVCRALERAHDKRIVHRDVKPANVMLGRFGEVYLVDWGLAATLDERADPRLPRLRDGIVGTPAYMAPEMVRGAARGIDERTDVYLLGATLYELVVGRPPHGGDSALQILGRILLSEPELPEDLPADLRALLARSLAHDPAARLSSVAAFRRAIEEHLEHRASIRIAREADEQRARLEELAAAGTEDDAALREAFGQCRFGFLQALSTWPENARARRGLDAALASMARVELSRGRTAEALALLEEASEVPSALRGDVDAALAREAEERALLAAAEAQRREMDPRVGRRQRTIFTLVLSVTWMLQPAVALWRDATGRPQQRFELALWPFVMLVGFAFLAWIFRAALLRTRINRRVVGIFVLSMGALGLFHLGALQLGLSVATTQALDFALYAAGAGFFAALVNRRFLLPVVGFTIGYFVVTARPELRYWIMLLTNPLVVASLVWIWPPWRDEATADPVVPRRE